MYASKMYREAAYVLHRSSTPTTLRSVAEITSRNRYKSEVILRQDKRVDSVHSNQKSSQCSSDFEFSSRGSICWVRRFLSPTTSQKERSEAATSQMRLLSHVLTLLQILRQRSSRDKSAVSRRRSQEAESFLSAFGHRAPSQRLSSALIRLGLTLSHVVLCLSCSL